MNEFKYDDYIEDVMGAMVIDMSGTIIYLNNQCAHYLKISRKNSVGQHINTVFPETKMLENLHINKPRVVFYKIYGAVGVSVHVPIKREGKRIGLLEYDFFQSDDLVDEFFDDYNSFLSQELSYYKEEVKKLRSAKYSIENIIGRSSKIQKVREQIQYAAKSDSTVLITGETGTGKELVAHAIHNLSNRRHRDFVKINASALPETLAESELFGYEDGAFTGAKKEGKKGKFELAHKGTLFIDEMNQMPLYLQPKLLRVLQEKEVDRIGGAKSISIDTRIIAATNRALKELVDEGKFREDLYYRFNVVEINLPPLREWAEDIPLLVYSMIEMLNSKMGTHVIRIDPLVIANLQQKDWPGNVRELQNVLERAMNYVDGEELSVEHFGAEALGLSKTKFNMDFFKFENPIEAAKRQAEKDFILHALEICGGNKKKTAEFLGISRPLLYQKMNRIGLPITV